MKPEGAERAELWERRFEIPVLIAALLVVPVIVLQEAEISGWLATVTQIGNWYIWLVFAAELIVMMAVVPDRRAWLKDNPFSVPVVVLTPPIAPAALQSLRLLRLLRLVRLGRSFRIIRRNFGLEGLPFAAALVLFLIVSGGVAFSTIEDNQAGQELSPWDGVWWAITTVTTVGYGDVTPHTDAGRIIGLSIMVVGIGFVALLTASMAQLFVSSGVRKEVAKAESDERAVLVHLEEINERLGRLEIAVSAQAVDPGVDPSKPGET